MHRRPRYTTSGIRRRETGRSPGTPVWQRRERAGEGRRAAGQAQDTINYAAVFISLAALIVSVLALYWTSMRGPKLEGSALQEVAIVRFPDGRHWLGVTLFVVNRGGATAGAGYLFAEVTRVADGQRATYLAVVDGEEPLTDFMGMDMKAIKRKGTRPISLLPGASEVRRCLLRPKSTDVVQTGEMVVEVFVRELSTNRPRRLATQHVRLAHEPKGYVVSRILELKECVTVGE